ncbi:MAG: nhaA [Rickettsiaceae bacterium]|jgi:NhaA family Na+:H+ antiporter|nr:nhaA [Rickettsiaceae bacterium]
MKQFTKIHIHKDTLSALLLFLGVMLALIISNHDSALSYYRSFINYKFTLGLGPFTLDKTILKFVNDGLMAIFFFFLGLEMKYHITEGEFKERKSLLLPTITAVGGFVVPAFLYLIFNLESPDGKIGWAIPVATDTAFVLAILSLIGNKVSNNTRVFVVGLSIIDDVLAVLVLAIFYTPNLDLMQLLLCSIPLGFLTTLNLRESYNRYLYYLGGIALWLLVVRSGVHGTIAGILLALFIPTNIKLDDRNIPLIKEIESSIHSVVAFFVLPLFAFVNCELPLNELSVEDILSSISMGCFVGLFVGKPLGIFGTMIIAKYFKIATLPQGITKGQLLGISFLCGIGFTLSLFIGLLAFDSVKLENQMKVGVLLASLFSAIIGTIIIKFCEDK